MPFTIDEEKFQSQETLDLSKPQGTKQGLPVVQISHQEYPKCVYKHPVEPYREVVHRNVNHEIVHRELVATEHKVHVVQNAQEFKQKLKEGWVEEPFIPQAPPDPDEHLYTKVTDEVVKRIKGQKAKPETATEDLLDIAVAQKFLQSRGYTCAMPEDASTFVDNLTATERAGFLKELSEFVASDKGGK